ncbi:MAG: hypothetical protein N3H30_02730 [Candidatus Micrarchaeota archaeon]|nr:hypothetical protein [Candidatus Micrarchaeota archaeon]
MQNSSECKEYARTEIERAMLPRGKARFEIEYNNAIAKRKLIEKYGEDAPKKCLEQPRVAATLQNAQKRKEREAKENIPSKPQSGDRNFWKGIGEFVWLCAVFIIITGFLSKIFDAD